MLLDQDLFHYWKHINEDLANHGPLEYEYLVSWLRTLEEKHLSPLCLADRSFIHQIRVDSKRALELTRKKQLNEAEDVLDDIQAQFDSNQNRGTLRPYFRLYHFPVNAYLQFKLSNYVGAKRLIDISLNTNKIFLDKIKEYQFKLQKYRLLFNKARVIFALGNEPESVDILIFILSQMKNNLDELTIHENYRLMTKLLGREIFEHYSRLFTKPDAH